MKGEPAGKSGWNRAPPPSLRGEHGLRAVPCFLERNGLLVLVEQPVPRQRLIIAGALEPRRGEHRGQPNCIREVAQEIGRELGWEEVPSIAALLRGSDCVSVHLSAHDSQGVSNAGRLGGDLLLQLGADRPESSPRIFVNLARGFLYTPAELLAALNAGSIRRAAVDVYPDEPRGKETWVNPYVHERKTHNS